jgi:transcriptional regulator PpsR
MAVGRDLRAITAIQRQFVEAQQEIEREYWKHRQAETRYRVLFQVATDAVLVVEAETYRILDANQAANALFDIALDRLIGMDAISAIDRSSRPAVAELLANARASGLPGEIRAWVAGRRVSARISATPFRSAESMLLLVRARAVDAHVDAGGAHARLIALVERTPDAVVVADAGGRVLMANPAFIELAQFADEPHAKGRALSDLIGTRLADVLAAARDRGIAVGHALELRGLRGRTAAIEVSAALLAEEDQECIGLTIRVREPEAEAGLPHASPDAALAGAIAALTCELGRLGLTELLAQVADQAEHHFIRAALRITDRDRTAAARILGVSEAHLDARLRNGRHASAAGDNQISIAPDTP